MAHLCCSIEMEPRTLSEGQLSHAREEAVDIIQKVESNEASNIFIKGMRPVVSIKEMEQIVERRQELQRLVDHHLNGQHCKELASPTTITAATTTTTTTTSSTITSINGQPCHCSCTSTTSVLDGSPDNSVIREPLSAPF